MKIIKVNQNRPDLRVIERATRELRKENIIIHPTETVYGFAALYSSEKALTRVAEIKLRDREQPFSIMVSEVNNMLEITGQKSKRLEKILKSLFPGR